MLLIEKVIKLLDDFHFGVFREYLRDMSTRSYYPLALIDVLNRDFETEQEVEKIFKNIYGESPSGEKDMNKLWQLSHYTFKLTSFLARNYPDYLQHNITRIQHLVNKGKLSSATRLAEITLEVSEKIEDYDTSIKILRFFAQREAFLESHKEASGYYEQIAGLLRLRQDLNEISLFVYQQLKDKGKEKTTNINEILAFLQPYRNSKSQAVQLMARLNASYLLYLSRDPGFYTPGSFAELEDIEDTLNKYEYIIFPHLHNLRPKLSFLKLNYSVRQLDSEKALKEAGAIMEHSDEDLFWHSFINQPEINSISIQTSYLVSNFFTSYRSDHAELLPQEKKDLILFLKNRCKSLLDNKFLQENYLVRYINLTTVYSGLLLLGTKKEIEESFELLENLLLFYQQVPFHAYIDPIYTNMIMAGFCLKDFEKVERSYRRYKKSTSGKVVNQENDLALHGFYYAAKWIETKREQYVKKLAAVIEQTSGKPNLDSTNSLLLNVSAYFNIPV
ncbi:MAG: hypothetical protein HUU01_02940 [Saprospiraceae bacterium]|nr:hypothetical protein [Saprospiraceae bacterium]